MVCTVTTRVKDVGMEAQKSRKRYIGMRARQAIVEGDIGTQRRNPKMNIYLELGVTHVIIVAVLAVLHPYIDMCTMKNHSLFVILKFCFLLKSCTMRNQSLLKCNSSF